MSDTAEHLMASSELPSSNIHYIQRPAQLPARIDAAIRTLAEATEPQQLIDLGNEIEAARAYAVKAGLGLKAQNFCATLRLRCERKLGQMLATIGRNPGGRPPTEKLGSGVHRFSSPIPTLDELGVPRRLSGRAAILAQIPEIDFETYLKFAHEHEFEITYRNILRFARRIQTQAQNQQRIVGGRVTDLIEFSQHHKMGTIMIDPPWWIEGNPIMLYDTISDFETLRQLPIPQLAADRCHLHIWCLPNHTHRMAQDLIEAWGFRFVAEFVWVKSQIGRGQYWRMSHETLLTAVNSDRDRFADKGLKSWIEAPRGKHSEKPDEIRRLIERASPPPRLELFARQRADGWLSWGHEIDEF